MLLIDTAGRLQNKDNLMAELAKIIRVLKKLDPTRAALDVLLVLDATTGQNAHAQVEVFRDMVAVTGLIVTKLDGSARGGVLVALAERFGLPVHAIGVGERHRRPAAVRPRAVRPVADGSRAHEQDRAALPDLRPRAVPRRRRSGGQRLHAIYDANTGLLRDAFRAYSRGEEPASRVRACYPYVSITVSGLQPGRHPPLLRLRRPAGHLHHHGHAARLFHHYLTWSRSAS